MSICTVSTTKSQTRYLVWYYDESKNSFALIVSAVIVDICTHAKIRSMMFKFNNCDSEAAEEWGQSPYKKLQ